MNKPHKHAELIKAWADGKQIQHKADFSNQWVDCEGVPEWNSYAEYRVKAEPKPDNICYGRITDWSEQTGHPTLQNCANVRDFDTDNVKFTFDGETGKLKAVELL